MVFLFLGVPQTALGIARSTSKWEEAISCVMPLVYNWPEERQATDNFSWARGFYTFFLGMAFSLNKKRSSKIESELKR